MMSVSKKSKIVKQLFGESKEEFEPIEQQGDVSVKQTKRSRRVRAGDATHQEREVIKRPRRVIKIPREAIAALSREARSPALV